MEEILRRNDITVQAVVSKADAKAGRGQRITPSPVTMKAQEFGLTVLKPVRVNDPEFVETLRALSPEAIVVAAYGQILRRSLLTLPPLGCINVHASLLPRHRGPDPIRWTLLQGDAETGVTVMLMDEGVDTGPILAQQPIEVGERDNYSSLVVLLGALGGTLLGETLIGWRKGTLVPRPQEGEVSYAPCLSKEEARISWGEKAERIVNRIRAFTRSPGAYTFWRGKRLKVIEAFVVQGEGNDFLPGTIVNIDRERGIIVKAQEGYVALYVVQPENRSPMLFRDLCCGYQIKVGDQFQ